MGLAYALMKRDKPEVFDLGKGSRFAGWPEIFERRYGEPIRPGVGNFLEPLSNLRVSSLAKRIEDFDNGYSGDPWECARRIVAWMGSDVCFLINYWEELESMIDDEEPEAVIAEEFKDVAVKLTQPISTYQQTGDVWGGT